MASDRCCCGLCHVKTGTWIIAVVHLALIVLGIVQGIIFFLEGHHRRVDRTTQTVLIVQFIMMFIWLLLVVFLVMALVKNRASWIIPHLIASVVALIWAVVQIIMIAVTGGPTVWWIIFWILGLVLIAYLLYVEFCCYKWMKGEIV